MNTKSIDVAPSPICFLARQLLLLLHKNSTVNVLILYILWIIVYANCIFSLYAFPSTHFKDDDEYDDNLTINDWIFNMPSLSTLFNYSSTSIFLNNYASSSCLYLCSLLCASFTFVIFCSFSITISAFMLMWILELWKHAQLLAIIANYFWWLPHFFSSLNDPLVAFIFLPTQCLLIKNDLWN
jgi:hypothetical protein